jgi:hypothetical protein
VNKLEEIKRLEERLSNLKESLKPKKFKLKKEFIEILEEDLSNSPEGIRVTICQGTPIDYFKVMVGLYDGSISEGIPDIDDDGDDGVVFGDTFIPLDMLEEIK